MLVEDSEAVEAWLIDQEISQTVAATLQEYQLQVQTANAVEDRLCELAGEMVDTETSSMVRTLLEQGIQEALFDEALPQVSPDLMESFV